MNFQCNNNFCFVGSDDNMFTSGVTISNLEMNRDLANIKVIYIQALGFRRGGLLIAICAMYSKGKSR